MTSKRPTDGEVVRLGKLIVKAKVERCGDRNLPVFSMTMRSGIVRQSDRFKKTVASKDTSNYKVVFPNQLVVGFPIDEGVIYVQRFDGPGIMSPAYNVWDIDTNTVLPAYLELALHSPQSMEYYATQMKGTTARRRTLSADKLCAMRIPLPTLTQQKSIVKLFERVKESLSIAEIRLSKLDELVKSRFVEMFGDLEHNEAGWPVLKFDDFAIIDTHMTNDFAAIANVPHIGIDSIESNTGEITGYRTVAEDGVKSGKYPFTSKHIIYSKIRPALNKVALPTFSGVCSADAYPILPVEGICDRYFLAYVMRSHCFLKYILPLSGRAQMPKVNKDAIRNFTCPFPPFALQRQFADFVTHVDKLRAETQRQKQDLQTLYDSLAQEYFAM